jgi:hypothetical protein
MLPAEWHGVEVIYMRQRKLDTEIILERVDDIEKTLEFLKRDIIKGIELFEKEARISLYGSVKGGDITEEMIDRAKRTLFRDLEDI